MAGRRQRFRRRKPLRRPHPSLSRRVLARHIRTAHRILTIRLMRLRLRHMELRRLRAMRLRLPLGRRRLRLQRPRTVTRRQALGALRVPAAPKAISTRARTAPKTAGQPAQSPADLSRIVRSRTRPTRTWVSRANRRSPSPMRKASPPSLANRLTSRRRPPKTRGLRRRLRRIRVSTRKSRAARRRSRITKRRVSGRRGAHALAAERWVRSGRPRGVTGRPALGGTCLGRGPAASARERPHRQRIRPTAAAGAGRSTLGR